LVRINLYCVRLNRYGLLIEYAIIELGEFVPVQDIGQQSVKKVCFTFVMATDMLNAFNTNNNHTTGFSHPLTNFSSSSFGTEESCIFEFLNKSVLI